MDSFFRGLMKTMQFHKSSHSMPVITITSEEFYVVNSPRSFRTPMLDSSETFTKMNSKMTSNHEEQQQYQRVAHWDKKREKCKNCKLIYLKTLSRHPGFCSVDCKSNAAYMDDVNRTIRVVEENLAVVENEQVTKKPVEQQEPVEEVQHTNAIDIVSGARTFAEFGVEERLFNENIEWAFSAMY
jgi:NACalpha-BTF3-like transcription factor